MEILTLIVSIVVLSETTYLIVKAKSSAPHRVVSTGKERNILLDTSVLIDGRIIDIVKAGFAPGTLQVPRSVIGELQLLADGSNDEKRARARFGLETLAALRESAPERVAIYEDETNAPEGVDARLRSLARSEKFELCTLDFNLLKVAEIDGITVLNINDLSNTLRMIHLPGEQVDLILQQKGQERSQAVGYAEDGTMVVVENSISLIGQKVKVEIIRSIQTSSGRMMFAKLVGQNPSAQVQKPIEQAKQPQKEQKPQRNQNQRRNRPNQQAASTAASIEGNAEVATDASQSEVPKPAKQAEFSRQQKPQARRGRRASQSPEDELLSLVDQQSK